MFVPFAIVFVPVHPHIRGAYLHAAHPGRPYWRFIPTYVGHTAPTTATPPPPPVHPHIRGAYCTSTPLSVIFSGSSPHTWGILAGGVAHHSFSRFIPTHVGHTRIYNVVAAVAPGSSPHTWGIPVIAHHSSAQARFIPTYVGHTEKTFPWGLPSTVHPHLRGAYAQGFGYPRRRPVHPHLRGAYSVVIVFFQHRGGSSPPTWGIRASITLICM